MSDELNCEVCQKPASQKCGGCHAVAYCSKEHQKIAWKTHKKLCKPFKVCDDAILGRHLVSTRAIKAGEIILQESPLVWGPSQTTIPVCLGCGKTINEKNCRPCSKCGWPMCSEICERAPAHIPECRYTVQREDRVSIKNFGMVHPMYMCITVLRCLYQKQFLPEVWKKIDKLQSHCEERKKTPKYADEKLRIVQLILRFFKLENVFTEDEILRICGILTVNGHEVPLTEPPHVAIFQSCSLFEHSCRPNCMKTFTEKGEVLIKSGDKIEKGEHLSICYTDPLWGTWDRRHHLYETKFFWCNCVRCQDVTEFGTYFSALKCQKCDCKGYVLPKTFIINDKESPLDWNCNKCQSVVNSDTIQDVLEKIGKDLSQLQRGSSKSCKDFLKTYENYLHQNHHYMTDVKIALTQILGQEFEGGLTKLSEDDLHLKARYCQGLNNLIKTIIPAETRIRGLLLFELHAAVAEIGRRKSLEDPDVLHQTLLESKKILAESAELLKFEPIQLAEGKIYQQARMNLVQIDQVLKTVHRTFGDSPV